MRVEMTAQEADVLASLLDAALRERHHELHHTDSRQFRARLLKETELLEALRAKLEASSNAA